MKRFYTYSILFFALLGAQQALSQGSNWEVGIRFPENTGIDLTIPVGIKPRLHTTVYMERFGVGGYFDWMFELTGKNTVQGLKFYPGVGPEMFFEHQFDFGVAGDFGAEYTFKFPLTVGFDWRPGVIFTNGTDFHAGNWGIIARFRFGEGTSFKSSK
jgi:hypothetical protein